MKKFKKADWHHGLEADAIIGLKKIRMNEVGRMLELMNMALPLLEDMSTHTNHELERSPRDYIHGDWISKANNLMRLYRKVEI